MVVCIVSFEGEGEGKGQRHGVHCSVHCFLRGGVWGKGQIYGVLLAPGRHADRCGFLHFLIFYRIRFNIPQQPWQ